MVWSVSLLQGQVPDLAGKTASELLAVGEKEFHAGAWSAALEAFLKFNTDFGGLEETAAAVNRVKPWVAICHVQLGQAEQAMPLLAESLKLPDLDANVRSDLVFFAGLCALQNGDPVGARTHLGTAFQDASMEKSKRMEALILGGMSYAVEKNWMEMVNFFNRYGAEIARYSPEAGARSKILLLHALMQSEQWERAEELAKEIHAAMEDVRQVVTFSSMLIGLGDHFLNAGEAHRAIQMLQRVPSKVEILRLQRARLAESEAEGNRAERARRSVRAAQLRTVIDEMKRELTAFEATPQFDSAARLRMAGAYLQLERTREACLILDQMVRQMEPDAIVESAAASLMRGWMSLERYARAARTAELYLDRLALLRDKPNQPEVMFLRAQALEGLSRHREASDRYWETASMFPKHAIAPRAEFMAAYTILQCEDYARAGTMLDSQRGKLDAKDDMWVHVIFWRAMAYAFSQQWEPCRQLLEEYLSAARNGEASDEYVDDACFRIAFSHYAEANYGETIRRFSGWERDYPTSEWLPEALLVLGDALAAEGDLKQASLVYSRIGKEAEGFHDEGWMKRGNIYKVTKDYAQMKQIYTDFLRERPSSPRIAEALHWLGWIAQQEGNSKAARNLYWDAIGRFGNDNVRPGLEEIFLTLPRLYPTTSDRSELENKLMNEFAMATDPGKRRYANRLGWALAHIHLSAKGSETLSLERKTARYRDDLIVLAPHMDPQQTAPRILADVADALAESGDREQAVRMYEGLRKWWPRAPERDRAYAGLGFLAASTGDVNGALGFFDRYEQTSLMPKTSVDRHGVALVQGELGGKVALARAGLLAADAPEEALPILLSLQQSKSMPTRIRAEAFLQTAELHGSRQRFRESLPYYEQLYILFNRYPDLVARAYWGRGQALEKLERNDKAREVYSEAVHRADLMEHELWRQCSERARALGGLIEPNEPAGSLIPPQPKP